MARCCLLLAEHQRIHGSPCNYVKISPDPQRDMQLLSSFILKEVGWSGAGVRVGGVEEYSRDINVSHV